MRRRPRRSKAPSSSTRRPGISGSPAAAGSSSRLSGNPEPGGEPANYAVEVRRLGARALAAAVRGVELDLLSPQFQVDGADHIESSVETLHIASGTLARNTGEFGATFDLTGNLAVNQSQDPSTIQWRAADSASGLSIPVDVTYVVGDGSVLRLHGRVVATCDADGGLRPRVDENGAAPLAEYAGAFAAGGAPVPAVGAGADGLRVIDGDSPTLTGATVSLLDRLDGPAETLDIGPVAAPMTASYDPARGTLTLGGAASPAEYEAALRTVTYANVSASPTLGPRRLGVTVFDESGPGPVVVGVIAVEGPAAANVARLGDGAPKSLTFIDPDGTSATISFTGGGSAVVRMRGAVAQVPRGRGIVVDGTGVRLEGLELTHTGPRSRFTVKTGGGRDGIDLPAATIEGPLAAFGGKGLSVTGRLHFGGRVTTAAFNDVHQATISAPAIGTMTVNGVIAQSDVALEQPFDPSRLALGKLSVRYHIFESRIESGGSIGAVKASGMGFSQLFAGVETPDRFPGAPGDFGNDARISSVALNGAPGTSEYTSSVIAARHLGTINLGELIGGGGNGLSGLTADRIERLTLAPFNGRPVTYARIDDLSDVQALLSLSWVWSAGFDVRLM